MKNPEVARRQQRLNHVFSQISSFAEHLELQAHWASYLCILVSGFLESSLRTIYAEYARHKSAPNVSNFVQRRLRGFQNPNMEAIIQLTSSFNPDWARDLKDATDGELKDAVDSIVANRHRIAHGESVDITYIRIKGYYAKTNEIIEFIENQCNP